MQTGNLKVKYNQEIRKHLKETLGKKNIYQVPKLEKIVLNIGFGKIAPDEKTREQIATNLAKISGQKPIFTVAKKAIAGFKIREGQIIGAKASLRGDKMYHFFEKLVSIVIPRLRDFRGLNEKSFDTKGNYTIGFREINLFPEIEYKSGERAVGLEITICSNALNPEEAEALLRELGMPFRADKVKEQANRETVSLPSG
ncbi:MAG: 50S ribosomal protein L5 [bacterium]|nr:50S ribosomal protein L5 [bacterium]